MSAAVRTPLIIAYGPDAALPEWRAQTQDRAGVDTEWWAPVASVHEAELLLARTGGRLRVLLDSGAVPGPRWLARLLAATQSLAPDTVLTTLGNRQPQVALALADLDLPALQPQQLDAACWLLSDRQLLPLPSQIHSGLRLFGPDAGLDGPQLVCTTLHVWIAGLEVVQPKLPADARERAAEPLFAGLIAQICALPADFLPDLPGLDSRPVVLHLLHGWGGGAERWVLDLAAADSDRHHLLLRARGDSARQQHGEWLQLVDARAPQLTLRQIRLEPPNVNLAQRHTQYAAVLATLISDFSVVQLWISSLIGHALDALHCGLPLRWIGHDYFPFWPVLHVDFGDPARHFDLPALEQDLHASGSAPLRSETAGSWWSRRAAVVEGLLRASAELVLPSVSVQRNLQRVVPELGGLPNRVIAHGCDLPRQQCDPPPRERLRVLVLGRINGGKGENLLVQALPGLTDLVDLYLLGCGAAGKGFFGLPGVHVEMEFDHDELPALIQRIAPDFALLPRTVAETFSYVLSELMALDVPVLGTALGSLAERIVPEINGWLCPADAAGLLAKVAELCAQPARIAATRERLRSQPLRSLAQMRADYLPLLPAPVAAPLALPPLNAPSATAIAAADVSSQRVRLALDLHHSRTIAAEAQAEVLRRGEWGQSLARQFEERTRWAHDLNAELEASRNRAQLLEQLEQQHVERQATLQQQLAEQIQQSQSLQMQLADEQSERQHTVDELHSTQSFLTAAEVDRDLARARILELEHSSSWRLTAPLRWLLKPLRPLRETLAFRTRSTRQLLRRGVSSLRQRGVVATLKRLLRGRVQPPVSSVSTEPLADPQDPFETFALPPRPQPQVSIIIPVYNKFEYTEACLRSLLRVEDPTAFEVIVIDDGSSDQTWPNLQRIGGIIAHRNVQNLGFIGACNKGAELATAPYLFFLNNDTQVQDQFLSELLKVFGNRPDAGLVGSKLIYPDGRLQECGGIIFNDGSGWNYGRFDDPQHCHYGFVREVDYVSGAAIMLPRTLFWQLGGFDSHYAPAYYEDTDLAFKIRAQAGRKVYVAPQSRVVHFEGITSGTDVATGIKRFQVVNQVKFLERWAAQLALHPAPGTPILQARQHRVRGRILVIDACTPMPDQDSGSLRMFNLLRLLLGEGYAVSFFAENRGWHAGYAEALQELGVEALFHPWMPEAPDFFRERGSEFNLVIISRHYVAEQYLPLVKAHCPQAKVWFDTVDLHYLRERREAELSGDSAALKHAERTRQQECGLMQQCDLTLVVSSVERDLLAIECPAARVEILSNIHDIPGRRGEFDGRRDIFFVGGFQHPPNVDAVLWFLAEVWPRVQAAEPELVLHLIGSNTPPEIEALATAQVVVHGFVKDIEPFLDGCRLSIAPLRYGAGVKGKVNMSMSYGCPVVATNVAVEGMHLVAGVDALVADNAAQFAAELLRLYREPQLWKQLSDAGLRNVEAHFSLSAAREVLRTLL